MNCTETNLTDDYRWLQTAEGQRWLEYTASGLSEGLDELTVIQRLRKQRITRQRTALLVQQCQLRVRARRKFSRADQMLFDNLLYQQATDERLARYKALQFESAPGVTDWCCGLGGDLLALASVGEAIGVDRGELAVLLAAHNWQICLGQCPPAHAVIQADAEDFQAPDDYWFHIDPDRRRGDRRSTRPELFSPGLEFLDRLVQRHRHGAIKLAPASRIPVPWQQQAQRQWLGDVHECKQQLVRFGDAATAPGKRTAAAIDAGGNRLFEWIQQSTGSVGVAPVAGEPEKWLLEPHPAIIAARLTDDLATAFELRRLAANTSYLTGRQPVTHGALTSFEILTSLPLKPPVINAALQDLDCGTLEIKKRGVDHRLMESFQKRKFEGRQRLTLVLTQVGGRHAGLICRRV